jgi:hypothetical protein
MVGCPLSDPDNQLVGILLTQTGMSTRDSARAIHDSWTTLLSDRSLSACRDTDVSSRV